MVPWHLRQLQKAELQLEPQPGLALDLGLWSSETQNCKSGMSILTKFKVGKVDKLIIFVADTLCDPELLESPVALTLHLQPGLVCVFFKTFLCFLAKVCVVVSIDDQFDSIWII